MGTAYSWSLFSRPLLAFFGWTSLQVASVFAVMVFGVGVGAFAGGFLHDRFGPRPVAVTAALIWGLGYLLAGLGTAHFGLACLYLTYGIIGGLGGGMAYLVPGAVVSKWFPRHRGLANGVTLFGFGAGSQRLRRSCRCSPVSRLQHPHRFPRRRR
ncbi:MAG: MFS transporter [Candidatus Eremiobacteraeota bacterium]|nr:MFS transporter [Candidatus Eremiobacteraeota bacterium]